MCAHTANLSKIFLAVCAQCAHTLRMAKNLVNRTRKGTNLYLPPELVLWGKEYAKRKHGITLSEMVERRLLKIQRDAEAAK